MDNLYRFPFTSRKYWMGFILLVGLSLACSAAGLVQRAVPTLEPTRALAPTFTPTPETILPRIVVTPPQGGTPGVITIPEGMNPAEIILTILPTPIPPTPAAPLPGGEIATLAPGETPPPTLTETPIPPPTNTPVPTPTPFIIVESGLVSLRTGPGVEYPLVAQLGPRIPIAIVGQNPEGSWYQLCCVNGTQVWVASTHAQVRNDPSLAALTEPGPPPPPTPTATFTATPTVTPTPTATLFPFDRAVGPQFFPTENKFLTIWVKLFVGTPPTEDPAGGYYLKVFFQDVERQPTNERRPSSEEFFRVGPLGTGYGNLTFNLKYEYTPPDPRSVDPVGPTTPTSTPLQLIGTGNWRVYVVDGAGNQLSDTVEILTDPGNPNREVYIAWVRVR